jgi:hypothetical protein
MTGLAPVGGPSGTRDRLRRATEVLREGGAAHEWRDEDVSEVTNAVAEHLLAVAATLPSNVPPWLADWQRLARRYGAVVRPLAEEPGVGLDALIDIKARLEQVADHAERSAARSGESR